MEMFIKIILCGLMILQVIILIFTYIDMIKTSKRNKKMCKEIEEVNELQRQYYLKKISEVKPEIKKRGRPKKKVEEK